jgi:hypothetical protein
MNRNWKYLTENPTSAVTEYVPSASNKTAQHIAPAILRMRMAMSALMSPIE